LSFSHRHGTVPRDSTGKRATSGNAGTGFSAAPVTAMKRYLVDSGTGDADWPPMLMVSDDPGGTFAGTCTFTWYKPMKARVRPEKDTVAGMPPSVAVAGCGVVG